MIIVKSAGNSYSVGPQHYYWGQQKILFKDAQFSIIQNFRWEVLYLVITVLETTIV